MPIRRILLVAVFAMPTLVGASCGDASPDIEELTATTAAPSTTTTTIPVNAGEDTAPSTTTTAIPANAGDDTAPSTTTTEPAEPSEQAAPPPSTTAAPSTTTTAIPANAGESNAGESTAGADTALDAVEALLAELIGELGAIGDDLAADEAAQASG